VWGGGAVRGLLADGPPPYSLHVWVDWVHAGDACMPRSQGFVAWSCRASNGPVIPKHCAATPRDPSLPLLQVKVRRTVLVPQPHVTQAAVALNPTRDTPPTSPCASPTAAGPRATWKVCNLILHTSPTNFSYFTVLTRLFVYRGRWSESYRCWVGGGGGFGVRRIWRIGTLTQLVDNL
jgi:hypothetical protein